MAEEKLFQEMEIQSELLATLQSEIKALSSVSEALGVLLNHEAETGFLHSEKCETCKAHRENIFGWMSGFAEIRRSTMSVVMAYRKFLLRSSGEFQEYVISHDL